MVFEINNVRVRPGQTVEFEMAFPQAAALLLTVPGCRSARLLRCLDQPGRYQIEVVWDRIEDHLDHYPATDQAGEVRALLRPLIESADLAHFEAMPGR